MIGSGPGGLQTSYSLRRLGVDHALISADDGPGGMFRKYPLFQRLITWTKPYAPSERGTPGYEWYDWNTLLTDDDSHRAPCWEFMDGTSVFPKRNEMENALIAFTQRAQLQIRFGCRWLSTTRNDDGFVLTTSDGDYSCKVAIFGIGMTEPWKPANIDGVDIAPHYADTKPPPEYKGKKIFIIGKGNSGFELADGLLPYARQLILASPRPARISILTHSTAAARARYLQPYEDHLLAGGTVILDAQPTKVERLEGRYRVSAAGTSRPGDLMLDVDEVIVATGFSTPLRDLTSLGVKTFFREGLLPAQTAFWESTTAEGIFFAGNAGQGSIGLKKYGRPSTSGSVHGLRYNAKVLASHVAERFFGVSHPSTPLERGEVVDFLLEQATHGPELWNQQSYLARVVSLDSSRGPVDEGIYPLAHFVDTSGPDAIAVAVETDDKGSIHPALYHRHSGRVDEHLLEPDPFQNYQRADYRRMIEGLLKDFI